MCVFGAGAEDRNIWERLGDDDDGAGDDDANDDGQGDFHLQNERGEKRTTIISVL